MKTLVAGPVRSICLPEEETQLALQSSESIAHLVAEENDHLQLSLVNPKTGQKIEAIVPMIAIRMLAEVLANLAKGNPVTLLPLHAELSTQQAADLLGVSRPYFVKLLDQNKIPYRKVGEQRRVRYADLLHYLEEYQKEAHQALDEIAQEAQRLGLYE